MLPKKPVFVVQAQENVTEWSGSHLPLLREILEAEFVVAKEKGEKLGFKIVDPERADLVHQETDLSPLNVTRHIIKALELSKREIPKYLKLLEADLQIEAHQDNFERATFSMGCYWQGEYKLGQVEGVLQTDAGWWLSDEIVGVVFDPKQVSYGDLVKHATNANFGVYAHNKAQFQQIKDLQIGVKAKERDPKLLARGVSEGERKYYLKQNPVWRYLPLLPSQAAKVNSAMAKQDSEKARRYLSPRQIELEKEIKKVLGDDKSSRNLHKLGACNNSLSTLGEYDAELSKIVM